MGRAKAHAASCCGQENKDVSERRHRGRNIGPLGVPRKRCTQRHSLRKRLRFESISHAAKALLVKFYGLALVALCWQRRAAIIMNCATPEFNRVCEVGKLW